MIGTTEAERIGLEEALRSVIRLQEIYADGIKKGAEVMQRMHPAVTMESAVGLMLGSHAEEMTDLVGRIGALEAAFPKLFRLELNG